jgi:hypothetical protein
MRTTATPKTRPGKWSVGLAIVSTVIFPMWRMGGLASLSALLVGIVLLSSGCAQITRGRVSYDPKTAGDGAGGVIALYDVMKNSNQRDFYAQRVDSDGRKAWGEKGVLVGSTLRRSAILSYLKITEDEHSGAIVGKMDVAPDGETSVYQVTRLSPGGEVLWQRAAQAVEQMVGDGDGGVIVATDRVGAIFVDRIDSEGGLPWGQDGILITRPQVEPDSVRLTSDGAGGAILTWRESPRQPPPGTDISKPWRSETIFAQRVDPEGNLLWGESGTMLVTSPPDSAGSWQRVAGDGSGTSFVTWNMQFIGDSRGGASPNASLSDVYVQKLDGNGNNLWRSSGRGLEAGQAAYPLAPLVAGDGSGGAVITWQDTRYGVPAVYAQRVLADGSLAWQSGGTRVFDVPVGMPFTLQMVGDGGGGLLVSITFKDLVSRTQGIKLNKLESDGHSAWLIHPWTMSVEQTLSAHFTLSDGEGGVVMAWGTRKNDHSNSEASFVQRVDKAGRLLWGDAGVRLDE